MNNTFIFISLAVLLSLVSFTLNKKKTIMGFKKGLMMFKKMAVPFLNIIIIVSILLYVITPSIIVSFLGKNSGISGLLAAAIIGGVAFIPGFMAYPIAGQLLSRGASYASIATFLAALMSVGLVTLSLEMRYFGKKTAIVRNIVNFFIAILVGLIIGMLIK